MGRLLSGLWLLILFIACSEKLPDGVVAREKMPELLVDIHLMDAHMATKPIDSIRKSFFATYETVFQRHGIDSTIFDQSIRYYASRPTELNEIYQEVAAVIDSSIKEDEAIRAAQYRARLQADSLAQVHRRDSLFWRTRDSLEVRRLRHLLLTPQEADSTIDAGIPFDRSMYEKYLWYVLGLGTGSSFYDSEASWSPTEGQVLPDYGTGRYRGMEGLEPAPVPVQDRTAPSLRLRSVPDNTQ